jgi:hypothetical protein
MAGSRTLKLSILGDVDNLTKSLKTAGKDTDDFGDKIGKAGKAIGAAFAAAAAAAGAYALKIGVDGVKAAIEDEKAQTQLALALKNATGATEGAIAATEQFILQTSLATGVADDDLRPALARLARSTGSVDEAQKLLNTALDISIATGKPLEGVANALSKSYDGNNAALGKLGLGLSAAELKTMNFTEVQAKLSDLFGGAAAANADTYAGRIARMQVAFNEAKETIGFALLPVLEKLMKFVNDFATPVLTAFSDALSGDTKTGLGSRIADFVDTVKTLFTPIIEGMRDAFNSVKAAIIENKDKFGEFWEVIKYIAPLVGKVIGETFSAVGSVAGKVIGIISNVLAALKPLINFAIDGINAVIKGWNLIKTGPDVALIPKIGAAQPGFTGTMPNGMPLGTISTADVPDTSIETGGGGLSTGDGGLSTGGGSTVGGGNGLATAVATGVKAGIASAQISGTFSAGQFAQGEAASLAAYEAQLIQDAADAEWQAAVAVIEKQKVEDIIAMVTARVNAAPVTVNMGVVGDPEAAARAIVDVLNRSSGRGALGAEGLVL